MQFYYVQTNKRLVICVQMFILPIMYSNFLGNEVSLQWYQPSLEHKKSVDPAESDVPATQILAMWAVNKKSEKPNASMMWINQHQLINLHDR